MAIESAQRNDFLNKFDIMPVLLKLRGMLAVVSAAKWTATRSETWHESGSVFSDRISQRD